MSPQDLVLDGQVLMERHGAALRPVSADKIARAVRAAETSGGRTIRVATTLGEFVDLSFERFPRRPRLRVTQSPRASARALRLSLFAESDGRTAEVSLDTISVSSHAAVGGAWFAISPSVYDELAQALRLAEPDSEGGITLRALLRLQLKSELASILDVAVESAPLGGVDDPEHKGTGTIALYPYQRRGVEWLLSLTRNDLGGILADEMGLGKTVQVIAALEATRSERVQPVLVIGTSSILENWRRELERFAPSVFTLVHRGPSRTALPSRLREHSVVVTSYDLLVQDEYLLRQVEWDAVVLDEAQFVKNPATRRAMTLRKLSARVFVAVTGTPVENSLRDLWSILDICIPGTLGDEGSFLSQFPDEPSAALRLRQVTAPFVLRRRVDQVASDLPERVDIPSPLVMADAEAAVYDAIRVAAEGSPGASLGALVKLRQFCAHPSIVDEATALRGLETEKITRLLEILEGVRDAGEKALVFAGFTAALDLLSEFIACRGGLRTTIIDGRMPPQVRQNAVDDFSRINGSSVLLLNPRAAGVGLNITAANHVVHFTSEWNPAIQDQASARSYRRGQSRPVMVHRLFYAGTVEEVMEERLQRKRVLQDAALDDGQDTGAESSDLVAALSRSPLRA